MYQILKQRESGQADEEEDMDLASNGAPPQPNNNNNNNNNNSTTTPSMTTTQTNKPTTSLLTAELRQQSSQPPSQQQQQQSQVSSSSTPQQQQQQSQQPQTSFSNASSILLPPIKQQTSYLSSSPIIPSIPISSGPNFSQVPPTVITALSTSLKNRDSPMSTGSNGGGSSGSGGGDGAHGSFDHQKVQVIPTSSPFSPKNHARNLPPLHTVNIKQELLDPIIQFFESKTNYDCMPNSCKVMVFDIDLPVREAFYIAATNDISFATLWDSKSSSLVGMLTVTDLIDILLHYHGDTKLIQELIAQKEIRYWRQLQKRNRPKQLVHVTPEDSLLTSIYALQKFKIHRLPVVSPRGSLLQIITHSHLLAFLVQNMNFDSPIFKYSIEALGIGTYDTLITASPSIALFDALKMFAKYKVSAIPIVDDQGVVVDVFSRYDIVYLVRDGDYKLEYSLEEALQRRPKIPVFTCTKNESFEKVLRHLSSTRIHRLICVDDDGRAVGLVSISDIFSFLLMNDKRTLPEIKEKVQRGPQVNPAYMSNLFMEDAQHPVERPHPV